MPAKTDRITKEVIKEFLAEADEIVERINSDLMAISSTDNIEDADPDLLNSVFRGAHSLKGIAGMLGFQGINRLSHRLEDILDSVRLGKIKLSHETLDVLFEGMEFLSALIKNVAESREPSDKKEVDNYIDIISSKISNSEKGSRGTSDDKRQFNIDKRILNVLTEYEEHRLEENKKTKKNIFLLHAVFTLDIFDEQLSKLTADIKPLGEVISILPSSGEAARGTIEFDILVGTNKDEKKVRSAISIDIELKDLFMKVPEETVSLKKVEELNKSAKVTVSKPAKEEKFEAPVEVVTTAAKDSIRSVSSTVRVDIHRLDSLMNIVGELVLSKTIIGEITDNLKNMEGFTGIAIELYKANRVLGRKLDDLQNSVMSIRMISLRQVFEKMSRIVRKLSRNSKKDIQLNISGADTELDKLIVEELVDPLMHIIRNSIDHGIELPEERSKVGKAATGTISLKASQKGNYVVIEVEDDGRGINKKKVHKKAVEKKIIDVDDELKEKDIFNLLLIPGFSTKDEVSEISGRGVGMDVVKENISRLSGMVDIESEEGAGTKIILTLPITLAIIQALIIELSERLFAMPLNSVSEIIKIVPAQIKTIEKKEVMQLREETLPLLRLKDMFDLPKSSENGKKLYVVVVGFGINKIGIIVDALKGQQDIVIKSIGDTFKKTKGIAGATDLGNQKTVLVLDVGSLIEEALH